MKIFDRIKIDSNGCWLWTGAIKNPGDRSLPYGWIRYKGKSMNAHRAAWIETNGDIPAGLCVCHKCDAPRCINPKHLFLGTGSDNMKDMWNKGRHKKPSEGVVGSHSAILTLQQVKEIKDMLEKGALQKDIAFKYGICQPAISAIKTGKTWGRYV